MFRIPAYFQFETTMQDAVQVMTTYGRGDLLEGMKAMDRVWEEHCASWDSPDARFISDGDFYECYEAEVNAYNKVFSEMRPLFV